MGLPAGDGQLPAAEATPRNCALARVLLEGERDVTPLRGVDQRLARDEVQRTGVFFVTRERDDDPRAVERADALERLESVEDDDVAALHVGAARTGGKGVEPDESFTFAFEHRVEMADEQHPLAPRALSLGEQVAGAADG